ncbi:hypothetical protein XarzCFBP7410_05535 [Xanthomonas arboricola pv. zantedeschiae]|uniref:glycoside hydrolase family 95 protein n=1 Tax=Xanthomonas arboricola TaxID=56448 RepID=UPI000CEE9D93|nr:glycoside hydrolase family 95 protein [Xanthomonas arboricola]PPT84742.1 hypothetical protein XarzCFBP7410_05535 [Xanthomonas arboricola pv. zantedeschiae]
MRRPPSPPLFDPLRRTVITGLGAATLLPFWDGYGSSRTSPIKGQSSQSLALPQEQRLCMRYGAPAADAQLLREGLPIGNGRLGALVGGMPACEALLVSEGSLWSGGGNDTLGEDGQFRYGKDDFGSFMMLARLFLELEGHAEASDYRRELDLRNGCVRVEYSVCGTRYTRTVFASYPDGAIVLRLEREGPGTHSGCLRLENTRSSADSEGVGREIWFGGDLPNGQRHAVALRVEADEGTVVLNDGQLHFSSCSALTVVLCGSTDYVADPARGWRDGGSNPLDVARSTAKAAASISAQRLTDRHVADHRALFDRFQIDLGASTEAQRKLDTWQRVKARTNSPGLPDPELDATYLQFGRYLTIAASRDGLPINLQGLWLENNDPPWMSDYHTDINLQMNYWLSDRAGLGDCFDALARYCIAQHSSWTRITAELFNDPCNRFRNTSGKVAGWTVAISTNPFGGNGWYWHAAGNAWLCDSLWQHYEFTQDRVYLARIYPLMKGACEFWEARLVELEVINTDGRRQLLLVDDYDWSPEHGPEDARGITYAQELVWGLFEQYRQACSLLNLDAGYAAIIADLQRRLYLPEASPATGQLPEWMSLHARGEVQHRHLSPLVGLFPGDRIHPDLAPAALVSAARKLLEERGMRSFGWACAWRALCWARLGDAERAYTLVSTNLKPSIVHGNGTAPNFFDIYDLSEHGDATLGGVFQIDANLGTPAAMLEMLLYSRPGHIRLLPALPKAWTERGSVMGLGARGGFVVDFAWRDGLPSHVVLRSVGGTRTRITWGNEERDVEIETGKFVQLL